ncbi:MAG: hypothetical protein ACFCVG_14165 [Kineosporiaceae bacterium]
MAGPATGGDVYADAGPAAGGPRRPRRPWPLVALLVALTVGTVLVGGLAPGLVLRALPDPPPAPGLLDREGYHTVRLGQTFSECRSAGGPGGPCGGGSSSATAFDSQHSCTRYQGVERDGVLVRVWTRDGEVSAVEVTGGPAAATVRTWPGPALGDVLDPAPPELERFRPDPATPGSDLVLDSDGVTTRLADGDGDGRLDTATVATGQGRECRPDPAPAAA